MILRYELKFFDYWHAGSGLSAGARADSTVLKDTDKLPYVPGKTIKGLAREMAEHIGECTYVNGCFGGSSDEKNVCYDASAKNIEGACYFADAHLSQEERTEIISNKLQSHLYDTIASTKIDAQSGVAADDTLREIEVTIPLTLQGEIRDIPDQDHYNMIAKALKMVKRLGLGRTRGLGRCEFVIEEVKA